MRSSPAAVDLWSAVPHLTLVDARLLSFALLIGAPLLEIYLFIQVGRAIGAWPTVALVVLMALLGAVLVRMQGPAILRRMQLSLSRREWPTADLLEAMAMLIGGVLLFIPGFLTDLAGLLLLWPAARRAMLRNLLPRIQSADRFRRDPLAARQGQDCGRVIEGEYTRNLDE